MNMCVIHIVKIIRNDHNYRDVKGYSNNKYKIPLKRAF